jgi:hypothetical protein
VKCVINTPLGYLSNVGLWGRFADHPDAARPFKNKQLARAKAERLRSRGIDAVVVQRGKRS